MTRMALALFLLSIHSGAAIADVVTESSLPALVYEADVIVVGGAVSSQLRPSSASLDISAARTLKGDFVSGTGDAVPVGTTLSTQRPLLTSRLFGLWFLKRTPTGELELLSVHQPLIDPDAAVI